MPIIPAKKAREHTISAAYEKLMESSIIEKSKAGERTASVLVPVNAIDGLTTALVQSGYKVGVGFTLTGAMVTAVW